MPRRSALNVALVLGSLAPGGVALALDTAPRAIAMQGCSGSTWTLKMLRTIVRNATHVQVQGTEFEILKPEKNWFYTPSLGAHGAFLAMNKHAVSKGRALVFKADLHLMIPGPMVPAFQSAGVRLVYIYRANRLDYLICTVNDCFVPRSQGTPVFSNGTVSDLCFRRRRSQSEAAPGKLLVRFDPSTIAGRLTQLHRQAIKSREVLAAWGYAVSPHVAIFEELAEFTHDRLALPRSALAFRAVLAAWGLPLPVEAIAAVLQPEAGTRAPPPPHSMKIDNFWRVQQALTAPDVPPEVRAMLRSPYQPSTTAPTAGSPGGLADRVSVI